LGQVKDKNFFIALCTKKKPQREQELSAAILLNSALLFWFDTKKQSVSLLIAKSKTFGR